jgi:hypothetical protein
VEAVGPVLDCFPVGDGVGDDAGLLEDALSLALGDAVATLSGC